MTLARLSHATGHYLYMYACMLPYAMWDLPNKRINCEDVLINLMVGAASGLPPVPFQPAYAVQRDYGTPPPAKLLSRVMTQSGLSGGGRSEAAWADVRSGCTNELAVHFGGGGGRPLLREPAFQASPPWMGVPFDKRWIDLKSGEEVRRTLYRWGRGPHGVCRFAF